jgi:hypothetical protein
LPAFVFFFAHSAPPFTLCAHGRSTEPTFPILFIGTQAEHLSAFYIFFYNSPPYQHEIPCTPWQAKCHRVARDKLFLDQALIKNFF